MSSARKSPTIVRRRSPTASVTRQESPQQSLDLDLPPAANDRRAAATPAKRLWLCIYLPALMLEALASGDDEMPRAVFDDADGIRRVLLANAAAMSAGITAGLSANAALALLPDLELEQRDESCEQRTLLSLAGWAEQFTSFVAVEAPDVLLLELSGSLRLFDGLRSLRKRVSDELNEQGFTAALAIAPTPLAAIWLARDGQRVCIQDMVNLASMLSGLTLASLRWSEKDYDLLYGMGITCVGDCLRLPRQGFAKRFGVGRLLELDRAAGRLPDPRSSYRSPEQFCADYDLTAELSDSELILQVCRELLQQLEQFLLTRQLAVQRIVFSFFYLQHPATHLPVGCVQPDRAVEHWFELLHIRFERFELSAPVIAVRLQAGESQLMTADSATLGFSGEEQQRRAHSIQHLIERLGARLGDDLVHGVMTVAEHRPQYAWRAEQSPERLQQCQALPGFWYEDHAPQLLADIRKTSSLILRRPLWMLPEPQVLATRDSHPVYSGMLTLIDGPERLETGWWDEQGIARDYYVATNPKGVHLWVFHERNQQRSWYLHGVFG